MAFRKGEPMSSDDIKHFLVTLDLATEKTTVEEFGTDYDAAILAYGEAERADAVGVLNIVLISSDSPATIEKTHSSYFKSASDLLAGRR
jgi:hypothetical protein